MTTLLITTTHRHSRPGEPSGAVYTLDADAPRVTGRCPVIEPPYLDADPNPRGGMRGAKGIAVYRDEVFIANASVVHRFDAAWKVTGEVTHPSCANIHDVVVRDETLWVTSCSNDLLFQFNHGGRLLRHFNFRAYPDTLRQLGWNTRNRLTPDAVRSGATDFRDPRTHRHETTDGAHVNSVCFLPGGDLLVLLGMIWTRRWTLLHVMKEHMQRLWVWEPFVRLVGPPLRVLPIARVPRGDIGVAVATGRSALLRVGPDGRPRVVWTLDGRTSPTHSLAALPDGTVFLNDTTAGELVRFDPDRGVVLSRTKVTDGFLRGACPLPDGRVAVGSQRDVLLVDPARGAVVGRIRLSEDPHSSVYDIKVLPPGFAPLPDRLGAAQTVATRFRASARIVPTACGSLR